MQGVLLVTHMQYSSACTQHCILSLVLRATIETPIPPVVYKQEIKQEKSQQFSQFSNLPMEAGQLRVKYEHGRPSQWHGSLNKRCRLWYRSSGRGQEKEEGLENYWQLSQSRKASSRPASQVATAKSSEGVWLEKQLCLRAGRWLGLETKLSS